MNDQYKKSRLTIAIPVFERERYFEEALDSALSQSVECNIVVIDNGSSHDRFRAIVEAKNNQNIRFKKNATNVGMFANWNLCARSATTEFVIILGDDDFLEPNYAEEFEKALDIHPDIDCYYTAIRWFSEEGTLLMNYPVPYGYLTGIKMLETAACYGLGIPTTSMCIRTKIFQHHEFLETPHGNSDWLFVYTALAGSTLYGNKQLLAHYRKHPESDTLTNNTGFLTALSCVYIYWQIFKILDDRQSTFASTARQRAINLTIDLALNYRDSYRNFINQPAKNHLYAAFVLDTIVPISYVAHALTKPTYNQRWAWQLAARIRRKCRYLYAKLRPRNLVSI